MSETAAKTVPDFWAFLQRTTAKLDEESAKVNSDSDMKNLRDRWLNPKDGVLVKLEADPFFAMAAATAQRIFMDIMRDRVRKVESDWQDIWRSLPENWLAH